MLLYLNQHLVGHQKRVLRTFEVHTLRLLQLGLVFFAHQGVLDLHSVRLASHSLAVIRINFPQVGLLDAVCSLWLIAVLVRYRHSLQLVRFHNLFMVLEVLFQLFGLLLHPQLFQNLRLNFNFLRQDAVDLLVGLDEGILVRLGCLLPLRLLGRARVRVVSGLLDQAAVFQSFNAFDFISGRLVFIFLRLLVHLSVAAVQDS